MTYGIGSLFSVFGQQSSNINNQLAGLQTGGSNSTLGIASQLLQTADSVNISTPGVSTSTVSAVTPTIDQSVFTDIAAELTAIQNSVNGLDPGAVDADQSQARFFFSLTKSFGELIQATHTPGFSVINESDGSSGISTGTIRDEADEVFDEIVDAGNVLDQVIDQIQDTDLRNQLETIQDQLANLNPYSNSSDAATAISLADQALALLPGDSNDDFLNNFDLTTTSQTQEALLDFGFGVGNALVDIAEAEFAQASPDTEFLAALNDLLEEFTVADQILLGSTDFFFDVISETSDATLAAPLEAARNTLSALDINDETELALASTTFDTAFLAFPTPPPVLADASNPGGNAVIGAEDLSSVQGDIETNIQNIQDIIDNSGITDQGVLDALNAIVTELQNIDFNGEASDALDVISAAGDAASTAESTTPAAILTSSVSVVGGVATDFGQTVRNSLNNFANQIINEEQANAAAEQLALQAQAAVIQEVFDTSRRVFNDVTRIVRISLNEGDADDRIDPFGLLSTEDSRFN